MGTGARGPVGLDLIGDDAWPDLAADGPLVVRFGDGAATIAISDILGARFYCSCPSRDFCPHRTATLFLLGATPAAAQDWFLASFIVRQLKDAIGAYRGARGDAKALLLACEAGYVCLRDRIRVRLDEPDLRRRLAASLGVDLASFGCARHAGSTNALASALAGRRAV